MDQLAQIMQMMQQMMAEQRRMSDEQQLLREENRLLKEQILTLNQTTPTLITQPKPAVAITSPVPAPTLITQRKPAVAITSPVPAPTLTLAINPPVRKPAVPVTQPTPPNVITPVATQVVNTAITPLAPPQRDGFSVWAEGLFAQQKIEEYNVLRNRPDFDPRFFTITVNMNPIYAKDMTIRRFSQLGGMFNEAVWETVAPGSKDRYRKQPERMLAIDDPTYRPRDPRNIIKTGSAINEMEVTTNPASMVRAVRVIQKIGATNVPHVPNGRFLPTSLTQPEILRRYDGSVPGIGVVSERAYFNGLVIRTRYHVREELQPNVEEFNLVVRRALIQRLSTDYVGGIPPYYCVFVYFADRGDDPAFGTEGEGAHAGNNARRQRIMIYGAIGAEDLPRLRVIGSFREQILDTYGVESDPGDAVIVYELDTAYFDIDRVDVTQSGGGKNKNHNYKKKDYIWGRTREYASRNEGCYVKVLCEVIKAMGVTTVNGKAWRYDTLWRNLDGRLGTKTFGEPVPLEWAEQAAALFGLHMITINNTGEEIHRSNLVPCTPDKTMRVLLEDGHFSHVVHWAPTKGITHPVDKPGKRKRLPPFHVNHSVFYDFETVYTVEPGAECHVIPYSNAWAIGSDEIRISSTSDPDPYSVVDSMLSDINRHFHSVDIPTGARSDSDTIGDANTHVFYRMIAFNGSRFDHAILFIYMASNGWFIVQPPQATGKIRSMCFYLGKRRISKSQWAKAYLNVWDPCLFTAGSLSKVAQDFGIRIEKENTNHEEIQNFYSAGQLGEWLTQHREQIERYNKRDVEILRELCLKLEEVMGDDLYKHQTLPGLSYNIWRKLPFRAQVANTRRHLTNADMLFAVEDYLLDEIIRSAIIGGRVEGVLGDHIGDFEMYDVVSLYPYVMQVEGYPVGKESAIRNIEDATRLFSEVNNCIGFYAVSYDQSYMQTPHPILPIRKPDGRLDWSWEGVRAAGPQRGFLPDVTIRDLISSGAHVEWSNHLLYQDIPLYALVWSKAPQSVVFGEYVEMFKRGKQEEDRKKAAGLPYNVALRELYKLILNALSGKMSQRNFISKSKLWTSEKPMREYLTKKVEAGISPIPHIVCDNVAFTTEKKTLEEAFKHAHPSQVGVFIYAYARSYMWRLFFSKMKVWYTDTDSAVISTNDSRLLDKRIIVTKDNKEFGMLELETSAQRLIVVAPKTYALLRDYTTTGTGNLTGNGPVWVENGKQIRLSNNRYWSFEKVRMKGIRKTDQWYPSPEQPTLVPIENDLLRFYLHLLQEKVVKVMTWTFRTIIKEGRIEHRTLNKTIRVDDTYTEDDQLEIN